MKRLLTTIFAVTVAGCALAQNSITVMTDTNGFLRTPTNLFRANSNEVLRAVTATQTNLDYFWRTNAAAPGGISNLFSPVTVNGAQTNNGNVAVTGMVQVAGTVIATNYSGQIGVVSNGAWTGAKTTNLVNYGNAISSPNTAFLLAEQFGSGASAASLGALAVGGSALASGFTAAAIGNGTTASGSASTAVGVAALATAANTTAVGNSSTASNANSSAFGYLAATTLANQNRVGTASQYLSVPGGSQVEGYTTNLHAWGTNTFDAGSDVSFGRYPITTMANGNNAGVIVGTNVFVELSGPTGAWTNNGFANGRDGKLVVLVYQGGQSWTIANESGVDPVAANRVRTGTGGDVVIPGNPGMAILIYSGAASRWLMYTPASTTFASGSFSTLAVGTLSLTNQIASTNVSHAYVRTNFAAGTLYTNATGGNIRVSANAALTLAAVSGKAVLALEMLGNDTNWSAVATSASTVATTWTNNVSGVVTNNGTYQFVDRSTGAGNSATVVGGQLIPY